MTVTPIRRRYVDLRWGQLHVAEAGSGRPVILLHQTPRSWDEYREVLPILGQVAHAVAVDTPGMGSSDRLPQPPTVEGWAEAIVQLIENEGWNEVDLVGHHTGGYLACEVAAQAPSRVRRVVFSSTDVMDEEARAARLGRRGIDELEDRADGSHLTEHWQRRAKYYPPEPALLRRFMKDALSTNDPEEGHHVAASYRMEDRLPLVRQRALCVGHSGDHFSAGSHAHLAARLENAQTYVIADGQIPLEYTATEFANVVAEFLAAD